MAGRVIIIGEMPGVPPGVRADIFLRPGEKPPEALWPGQAVHECRDLPHALAILREVFSEHAEIATLGGTDIIGDPAWLPAIDARCAEFLDDLGNCALDSWTGARNAIFNGPALAAGLTSESLIGACAGRPAICIGAGPSATPEALAHVAYLQRNHYIFVADSMLQACRGAGIVPHFVCMVERPQEMARFVVGYNPEQTRLIAPPVVDPACVKAFSQTVFWRDGSALSAWLHPDVPPMNCGRSAGTLSIGAALAAGCSTVYLIGHDLAYAPGGVSHCPGTHALALECQVRDDARSGHYHLEKFTVPGWSTAPVLTNGLWNLFRGDIEDIVAAYPEARVVSAQGYQGAAIKGVEVGPFPEFGPLERATGPQLVARQGAYDPLADRPDILAAIGEVRKSLETEGAKYPAKYRHLFQYVLRALYSCLALRIHLRGTAADFDAAMATLRKTIPFVLDRMEKDLTT